MSISLRSFLMLSSHLRLGLPKGHFPAGVPVKLFTVPLPSFILATCPAHLNLLDLITLNILGERYKLWSSSLWSLLHSPFSSLLCPNILLRILFSTALSLRSCRNIYNTIVKSIKYSPGIWQLKKNNISKLLATKIIFWRPSSWTLRREKIRISDFRWKIEVENSVIERA